MNVPIDQLKEAIAYLEKKEMYPDTVPVFKWIIKDRVEPVKFSSSYPTMQPINELTFEYNYRHKAWELKIL